MVATGYGVTLLPEVAVDVEVRDERVKLLRFVEPQPQRQIGLAWRPTSPRKDDFLELGQILLRTLKCEQSHKSELRRGGPCARREQLARIGISRDPSAPGEPLPRRNELDLCGADVVAQGRGFEFDFLHAISHDVADRDDTDQPTFVHDRQMPKLAGRHQLHYAAHRFRSIAGDHFTCHNVSDRLLQRRGAARGEFAYNVPLGDDARDPLVRVDNDQCTNATCRQQLDSGRKIGGRFNSDDVNTFAEST